MGSSSSSKPQVTTTTSDPWSGAQPYLGDAMMGAQQLYQGHVGETPYSGPLVAPMNATQIGGFQQTNDLINQGNPLADWAYGSANNLIKNRGIDPSQWQSLASLQATSNGANIGTINPALQTRLDYLGQNAANKVNSSMSGAGRYGSGMHTQQLAREVTGAQSGLLAQDYADERNRQLQASGLLNQIYGAGSDRALQASGMAGQLDDNRFANARRTSGMGDFLQQQAQQQIDAARAQYEAQQSAPWDNVARYNAIATGQGSLGSTKVGVGPPPQTGGAKGALGGVITGGALGGQLGSAFPVVGNVAGAGLGGLLGGLGGYFSR